MYLNQLQQEMLYENRHKQVEIYANGRSVGHTTGVSYKAFKKLTNFCSITLAYPNYPLLKEGLDNYLCMLSSNNIRYRCDFTNNIVETDLGMVRFSLVNNRLKVIQRTMLVIESPELCNQEDIDYHIRRDYEKLCFVTQPVNCGWREFETHKGLVLRDKEKGDPVVKSNSWDNLLINWKGDETRADRDQYKDCVGIVTGYGCEQVMSKISTGIDLMEVQGEWVTKGSIDL